MRKRKKNKLGRAMLLGALAASFLGQAVPVNAEELQENVLSESAGPAYAPGEDTGDHWERIEDGWYLLDGEGNPHTGWYWFNDTWYYFGRSGRMQTGWLQYRSQWYYLRGSGAMATGWFRVGSRWYYFSESGVMQTGWLTLSGSKYYLDETGRMLTGWFTQDGNWYYFRSNGVMRTGWEQIRGKWYFFDSDGIMAQGWLILKNGSYYLNENGVMQTGWIYTDDCWQYLDQSGRMQTGWITDLGKKYLLDPYGRMVSDGWLYRDGTYYHFKKNGMVDKETKEAPRLVSMPGYYISPMYAGNLNTPEERIEAMIKRAYDYKNAGTTYKICKSQAPGQYADCSGLVMQCLYAAGFDPSPATPKHHALPENEYDSRTLYNQVEMRHVPYSERKRGDLIFYKNPKGSIIIHVAIYLGNGKVIESWPPAVTDKYGVTDEPHTAIYGVARPFE